MTLQFPLSPDPKHPGLMLHHIEFDSKEVRFSAQVHFRFQGGAFLVELRKVSEMVFGPIPPSNVPWPVTADAMPSELPDLPPEPPAITAPGFRIIGVSGGTDDMGQRRHVIVDGAITSGAGFNAVEEGLQPFAGFLAYSP